MRNNDWNHYFIRMDDKKQRKRDKKEEKRAKKLTEKSFDSPVNPLTDHQQNDYESQSSGEENEWDGKETAGTALKAVSDAPEPVKTTLSAAVPEVQMGVITPHVPPVTSVKKVVIRTDEFLKKSEVEEYVDEPMFDVDSISRPLKKVPSTSTTTPGTARVRDPWGVLSRKVTETLQPVKFSAKDPIFSEKFSSPQTYHEKLQRQIWPDTANKDELNKGYYALEAARKFAGPGLRSDDPNPPPEEADFSKEEIDLLIKCYMASNIIKDIPKNVETTKTQVREHIIREDTCIYFEDEFNRSFDFKVIGKMIDDYLNDTSLKSINALYHKYRVEMLVDRAVEEEVEINTEFGMDVDTAKAVIRKRGPERVRNEIKDIQTQETIVHDLSRMKLLQKLTVDFMNPWYHEMLLHIRRPNAFHWKQYVLENPLNEWEQKLKLFHGNN